MIKENIEEDIYNFNKIDDLPQPLIDQFIKSVPAAMQMDCLTIEREDLVFRAAIWWYYQRSLQELHRLGYQENTTINTWTMQRPLAVVEHHLPQEQENGEDILAFERRMSHLAVQYGLLEHHMDYQSPDASWQILATRRDHDAIIALIGDDRSNMHIICVIWSPLYLQGDRELPIALI
jgi:hypothetical protein